MKKISRNICISLVAEDGYLPGVLVTVVSFLKHNPWFTGDIVIFDAGLSKKNQKILKRKLRCLYFRPIPKQIYDAEYSKTNRFPKRLIPAFYKFEFFGLTDYDLVIGLDTDLLIQSELSKFLEITNGLGACKAISIDGQINTGVMVIGTEYLNLNTVSMLLSGIVPFADKVADQNVISHFFYEKASYFNPEYNAIKQVRLKEESEFDKCRIIHYTGKKPWQKIRLDRADKIWMKFYRRDVSWLMWARLLLSRSLLVTGLKFS
tara:strand:+ start:314 stop:1099 length:786 start_codon:yes stop_codon:yes gene_type:complete